VYVAEPSSGAVRVLQPLNNASGITSVTNAASNLPGSISPGEIVVLYGSGLGPGQLTQTHIGDNGLFGTQLSGTTVSFSGLPGPMIYTLATQVSAVVPYGIGGTTAQVTVTYQGQTTAAFSVPIASSVPGIFTSDSSGKGQAAALNQDNSLNTPGTPAKVGDVIVLFATGEGQTTAGGVDGKPATVPLPKPNLPVSVTIGGQPAQLQYFGGAPGEIAGLMQINAVVPNGIQTGNAVPVMLKVGDASSQPGVTIAVR
jgi:trimeric autotransporter adhesin